MPKDLQPDAYWRSRAMADAVGAGDAVARMDDAEAERLTEVCATCRFPDRCLLWRLEGRPEREAPGYCLNHTVFQALGTD